MKFWLTCAVLLANHVSIIGHQQFCEQARLPQEVQRSLDIDVGDIDADNPCIWPTANNDFIKTRKERVS